MTHPLDAEADQLFRDSCKPGLSIRDTAQIAIRTALEMRDVERAEVERWKQTAIAFCAPWAAQYAKEHDLLEGQLHPTHYDILKEAGVRMDAFTRAAQAQENRG